MQQLIKILRLSRPIFITLAAVTYFLGIGIARYLGYPLELHPFWLGLIGVILAQIVMDMLVEVFRPSNEPIIPGESITDRKAIHDSALYISIAGLAVLAFISILLFKEGHITLPTWFYLTLSLIVVLIYSVPPIRLVYKGYGEVLLAIQLGFFIPSISFLLQSGGYHRLLSATIVPVTFLSLTAILAMDFPTYVEDLKYARQTLLVRMGWERAIPLHQGLVIMAYALFALEPLFGFSFGLFWPAFLTIPFALLQIYLIRNIALGAKPIWNLITANAIAIFGMTVYFLILAFWLH